MVTHTKCPLCSSEEISLNFRATDHFISKEEFSVFKCRSCGFLFTQGYPEEDETGKYYESEDYISHSDTAKGLSNKLYRAARNMMLRKKRKLVTRLTGLKKGRLLDIGSGTGYFANEMSSAGWLAEGIEINEKARDFSSQRFGLDVFRPDQIHSIDSESYDCITLWHVLEHFHDPFTYAAEIKRLLKNNGICIIALPDRNSYDAEHYGKFWAAYDVPRHLWHFNPATFRLFAEKAGFSLMEIRNLPLDVFYISLLSEKYKGSSAPFIQGVIKGLYFSFRTLFNKEKSSSLIYILRKSEFSK